MAMDGDSLMIIIMLGAFAFFGWLLLIVTIIAQRKSPYIKTLTQANRKDTPIVFLYKVSNRMSMLMPKRNKLPNSKNRDNTLNLPEHYGIKFVPPAGKDCNLDKIKVYHYFTKLSIALTSVESAALTHFNEILGKYGLKDNSNAIDALIRCNLDPDKMLPGQLSELPYPIDTHKKFRDKDGSLLSSIEEMEDDNAKSVALETYHRDVITEEEIEEVGELDDEYNSVCAEIEELEKHKSELKKQYMKITGLINPITGEEIITLKAIQRELRETVINDGLFVWNVAEKFSQVYSGLQAKELDEIKATFAANSMLQNIMPDEGKNLKDWAFIIILAIIALAALRTLM